MSWRARLSINMLELRFVYSSTAQNSEGVKNFLKQNFQELQTLNPKLPILSRTPPDVSPVVIAYYDWGQFKEFSLDNATELEVEEKVRELNQIGEKMEKGWALFPKDRDLIDESDVRKFITF